MNAAALVFPYFCLLTAFVTVNNGRAKPVRALPWHAYVTSRSGSVCTVCPYPRPVTSGGASPRLRFQPHGSCQHHHHDARTQIKQVMDSLQLCDKIPAILPGSFCGLSGWERSQPPTASDARDQTRSTPIKREST